RVSDRTTTVVKNEQLPLSAKAREVFVTGWGPDTTKYLASSLEKREATVDVLETGAEPADDAIAAAVAKAKDNDLTVVTTMKAWDTTETNDGSPTDPDGKQQQLVRALLKTGKPVVVVAVRDPYDIAFVDEADTYLAAYAFNAPAMESIVRVMYGEVSPRGKLPVTIPNATDPTSTLYPFGHGISW